MHDQDQRRAPAAQQPEPWAVWSPPPPEPHRPSPVPGWAIGLVCGLGGLLIGGAAGAAVGGGVGTALSAPDPFPGQSYGDSPFLDRAFELCERGDLGACDILYDYSEPGSRYETYGASCGGRREPDDVLFCIEDGTVAVADDPGTSTVGRPRA